RSSPFQRIVVPAHGAPSCVMRMTAVPDRSADAAVMVAPRSIAAEALSPPGVPTVTNTATARAAASATPAIGRGESAADDRSRAALTDPCPSGARTLHARAFVELLQLARIRRVEKLGRCVFRVPVVACAD